MTPAEKLTALRDRHTEEKNLTKALYRAFVQADQVRTAALTAYQTQAAALSRLDLRIAEMDGRLREVTRSAPAPEAAAIKALRSAIAHLTTEEQETILTAAQVAVAKEAKEAHDANNPN